LRRGEALKAAFVTNICAHYPVKTFETLARYHDVDYYFFSAAMSGTDSNSTACEPGIFTSTCLLPAIKGMLF
jgi:hypothetical protein